MRDRDISPVLKQSYLLISRFCLVTSYLRTAIVVSVILSLISGCAVFQTGSEKTSNLPSLLNGEKKENAFFKSKERPLIIGHRGVPLSHQENSLAGFHKAVALGIDGIELDVFKTADNRIVVFHDESTKRLTGVEGNISEMTWDEVSELRIQKRIDRGDGEFMDYPSEQRIPLLAEVLETFSKDLLINIEMKAYAPNWFRRSTGQEVAKIIRQLGVEHRVIVTSFDFFMLRSLEKEYPALESGFTYDSNMLEGVGEWIEKISKLSADDGDDTVEQYDVKFINKVMESNRVGDFLGSTVVGAQYKLLDDDSVENLSNKKMLVGSYTLFPLDVRYVEDDATDHTKEALRLKRLGVDWIETDDPEKLLALYNQ